MSKKALTTVAITDKVLLTLKPAKNLSHHDGASVTSLDFDDSGQFLISAGVDRLIQLYDCHKGTRVKKIQSQKYGAHLARFTHHDHCCLYASTPSSETDADHSLRYLSLNTKSYLRYFRGHKDQVTALEVNPVSETFLTASADHTVKHWDLRLTTPLGNINAGQAALVAYDPQGIVFAIASSPDESGNGSVAFYDTASYEKGSFAKSKVSCTPGQKWTKLEFSNNGKLLLVGTDSSQHYVLDAMLGRLLTCLSAVDEPQNGWLRFNYATSGLATFTSCGKFVLAGSPSGPVSLYDVSKVKASESNEPVIRPFKDLQGYGVSKIVAFNPKLLNVATADDLVVLWSPDVDGEAS
ncbi:hypothetical protein C7M61_000457 [Candidozyma pseudohaemuli]|uniref:Uncharacterized protein n=1 Tax=Candidozyma pseudohaemuli TaxID=418784 RepID=A0A2P7YXZ0_9ASCO|nr:hypothetical protein C7M61_000457 [[Candida] pseudohaemulonii]PSK40802.1 hypothetical protein C7M61_000457 [[Candida] pseudohaemulonii]